MGLGIVEIVGRMGAMEKMGVVIAVARLMETLDRMEAVVFQAEILGQVLRVAQLHLMEAPEH